MTQSHSGHSPFQSRWRASLASARVQALSFLLAPALLFIATRPLVVTTDPDYWWHVRTGQYIYETGTLPRSDIYSYTSAGQSWVTHEWLTELLFYLGSRAGGYALLAAVFAVISGLTWLAIYAACRQRGMGEVGALLLMLWGFVMAAGSVNVRPQGITTLLLALCALILTRYRQGESKPLYLLPPLFALWVNLHGGYAIGLGLIALTVAGQALELWLRRTTVSLRPLLLAAVAALAATLLNPHGLTALTYPLSYASSGNASMLYLSEWQSPDFHLPFFLIFAASLLVIMVVGLTRQPLGLVEALWAIAFAFLALRSGRNIALYAVMVTPLVVRTPAGGAAGLPPHAARMAQQEHSSNHLAGDHHRHPGLRPQGRRDHRPANRPRANPNRLSGRGCAVPA